LLSSPSSPGSRMSACPSHISFPCGARERLRIRYARPAAEGLALGQRLLRDHRALLMQEEEPWRRQPAPATMGALGPGQRTRLSAPDPQCKAARLPPRHGTIRKHRPARSTWARLFKLLLAGDGFMSAAYGRASRGARCRKRAPALWQLPPVASGNIEARGSDVRGGVP
jgi:hypothetical protein